jgi:hypothetical protein
MKRKFVFLCILVISILGIYFFPSKYDREIYTALKEQEKHSEIKIFDGELEPAMPDKKENDKTILGIDSNKNGIRDDIDIWINRTGLVRNERMAMRQYAKAEQNELKVCSLNLVDEINISGSEAVDSGSCLRALSDYRRDRFNFIKNKIDDLTLNSRARNTCLEFFNKHSSFISSTNGSDIFFNCKFEVDNRQEEIELAEKYGAESR